RAPAYFFLWPGMDAKKFACPIDRQNLTALNRQVLRKPGSEVRQARDPRWVSRAAKHLSGNAPSDAGTLQWSILIASALTPLILNWRTNLATLHPFLRKLFWVYGAFIV